MKTLICASSLLVVTMLLVPKAFGQEPASKIAPDAAGGDDIAVQTRGPVHEAFAAPANSSPRPTPVVVKKPPDPIHEVPPDQKPEGDNVQWLPGYWAWDSDRNDYLWVSGFWRVPPPSRKWVPGHWSEADNGWRWLPGFWAGAAQEQIQYVEQAPPDSLENGPSVPAPDDNSTYVPGWWQNQVDHYVWRPGYWAQPNPGYVWVSPQYNWTPGGYCAVGGYWDHPLEDRGLLFAPVAFNRPLWTDPDWYYQPSYCLNFNGVFGSLFCRPAWGSYYFGDYYDPGYAGLGFYPWFSWGRRCWDPLYGYYGWQHRFDPGWHDGLAADFRGRRAGDLARPPRTFDAQNNLAHNFRGGNGNQRGNLNSLQMVRPLNQVAAAPGARLTKLTPTQVDGFRRSASAFHDVSAQRQRIEQPAIGRAGRPAALSLANVPTAPATARQGRIGSAGFNTNSGSRSANGPNAANVGRNPTIGQRGGAPTFLNPGTRLNTSPYAGTRSVSPSSTPNRTVPRQPSNSYRAPGSYTAPRTFTQPVRTTPRVSQPTFRARPSVPNRGSSGYRGGSRSFSGGGARSFGGGGSRSLSGGGARSSGGRGGRR